MKKILLTIMAITTALSLAACSSGGNANVSSSSLESAASSESIPSSEAALSEQSSSEAAESSTQESSEEAASTPDAPKTLVVYYSLTGTTKAAAEIVHQTIESDIFEITTVEPYPPAHDDTITRVDADRSEGKLPELSSKIENIDDYDTILIGYPIWRGTYADPIAAFLKEYDLSGKTVIPFSTSGSTTLGSSVEDLKTVQPGATVLDGLAVPGSGSESAITTWIGKLGIE